MIQQATNAKSCIVYANSIYPRNRQEAMDRQRAFVSAKAHLYSLSSNADDLMEMRDEISIGYEAMDEWTKKIAHLIALLNGVMDSDRERYKNLPES